MATKEPQNRDLSSVQAELNSKVDEALAMKLDQAPPAEIESRIEMSLQADTNFDEVFSIQQGESRVGKFLKSCENAITTTLCQNGKLKDQWNSLLKNDDTADLLKTLATTLLGLISPTFAVPSVVVLVALWLLRRGLDNWCAHPA